MSSLSENFGWIEIAFTAVVALGFGIYQIWSVNREIAADKAAKAAREAEESAARAGQARSRGRR